MGEFTKIARSFWETDEARDMTRKILLVLPADKRQCKHAGLLCIPHEAGDGRNGI